MNMDVPPLGADGRTAPTPRVPRGDRVAASSFTSHVSEAIPSSPPAHLAREVEAAARRAEWLREHGRELHFERTEEGRVKVEVRDLNGRLVRIVPPSEALEIVSGSVSA
jgi:hypothetical protein